MAVRQNVEPVSCTSSTARAVSPSSQTDRLARPTGETVLCRGASVCHRTGVDMSSFRQVLQHLFCCHNSRL